VVKHVDAAELRVVVLEYFPPPPIPCSLHTTPKTWFPCDYRTGPPACVQFCAKAQPGDGEHVGEKGRGGAGKCKKLRVEVWHVKQEMPVARARYPERENEVVVRLQPLELPAPCKARWM
jgi:hypothetical protein